MIAFVIVCCVRATLRTGGTSDPYCRLVIGDNIKDAVKTKTIKRTLCPEWNKTFLLPLDNASQQESLTMELFDHDLMDADDSLGSALLRLGASPVNKEGRCPHPDFPPCSLLIVRWFATDELEHAGTLEPDQEESGWFQLANDETSQGELHVRYKLLPPRDESDKAHRKPGMLPEGWKRCLACAHPVKIDEDWGDCPHCALDP